MRLSVIIPLFNESGLIISTLDKIKGILYPDFVSDVEIIVVDDGSTDRSYETVSEYIKSSDGIKVIRHDVNMGKGAAVISGAGIAAGDVLLVQDADDELNPEDIPLLLTVMNNHNLTMAGGSRFMTGGSSNQAPRITTAANKGFSFLATLMTGMRITDLTCGYKAIRKETFDKLTLREKRFGFETELMMKALTLPGALFAEVPVRYNARKRHEGKKIRPGDGFGILYKIPYYGRHAIKWFSSMVIIAALLSVMITIFSFKPYKYEGRVIQFDAVSYYSYLPATFIYHDLGLKFKDDYNGPHKFIFWPETAPNGKYIIKTTMGMSVMYLPFFFIGHVAAIITGADTGGFSEPYKIALLMGTIFYLAIGLIFLRKTLLSFCSDLVAGLVIGAIFFGTNIFWYSTYEGLMSHTYSFCLFSLFIWLTIKWHTKPGIRLSVLTGLLSGLITLVRPTNIIIIVVFFLYGVQSIGDLKEKTVMLVKKKFLLLIIIISAFIVWIPQMLYWKSVTDHFLFYSYVQNERFFFNNPHIVQGLFGFRKGLLLYTPVLLFSFAGIITLWKKRSPFAMPVTIFLTLNIYIVYSWWCWWYGGGFGSRPFIDCYALMAIPMASLLQSIGQWRNRMVKLPIYSLFLLLVGAGLFHHKQYYYGSIHWDSMTKEAYFNSFGRLRPSPEFRSLLAEPDYDKAKEGIDTTTPVASE